MTVYLPNIGVTSCSRAVSFLQNYPQNVVGSFWLMCGYGFETDDIPSWWIDSGLKENQAAAILDEVRLDSFVKEHSNPLYLGFCIIVISDSENPINLSYMIQHLRMLWSEGIELLDIMSQHNIPAYTEVTYPEFFLNYRYSSYRDHGDISLKKHEHLKKSLHNWSALDWEDYCSYLMVKHGGYMLVRFYDKSVTRVKEQVEKRVSEGNKPLILTEGETDPIYIKAALSLLNQDQLLKQVDIEWVGKSTGQGKSINTGDGGLKRTRDVLVSNPQFIENRKVLLLYDCDTKMPNEDLGEFLKTRTIPKIEGRKVRKGIENLFPDNLFKSSFYELKESVGDYGERKQNEVFKKMEFCKWICEERRQPEDFQDFTVIIDFIKELLK